MATKNGRPEAVLANVGEYERLEETLEVVSDTDLMRQIRANVRYFAKNRSVSEAIREICTDPRCYPSARLSACLERC